MNLKIISAGAGSGKTYTLTKLMAQMLTHGDTDANGNTLPPLRASGILATTFTNKSAAELKERVRLQLLQDGMTAEADELQGALINTVHSIGQQLLKRFAFEVGLSPNVEAMQGDDAQIIFNRSLATVLDADAHQKMHYLSQQLGFYKDTKAKSWQEVLRNLTDTARTNQLNAAALAESKKYSLQSFFSLLPPVSTATADWFDDSLGMLLETTIYNLKANGDSTVKTSDTIKALEQLLNTWHKQHKKLAWYEWVKIGKLAVGKKSEADIADLWAFVNTHTEHPRFHSDNREFISELFDLAQRATDRYSKYKEERGLIDFTDMEVLLLQLLDNPAVCEVLRAELDLLLVDEFQDTNPIQLAIFIRLASLVKRAIWVGDPKQSIYRFRGADPALMKAIVSETALTFEVLSQSWRSRQDLVHAVNGLFVPVFGSQMEAEHIALSVPQKFEKSWESDKLGIAVQHHDIVPELDGKATGEWPLRAVARAVADFWAEQPQVRIKGSTETRPAQLRDIAILCATNSHCQTIAAALHNEGLPVSLGIGSLLDTQEGVMVVACLKFLLNEYDTLAVAEILRFAAGLSLEDIISSRFDYLQKVAAQQMPTETEAATTNSTDTNSETAEATTTVAERKNIPRWASENELILLLNQLRYQSREFSVSEILQLLFEKLQLARLLAAWPNAGQRLANIEVMLKHAHDYEDSCQRLRTASTLGGFILWLEQLRYHDKAPQAQNTETDAIQLITYHGSKGLEWPIVFLTDLDKKSRNEMIGVRTVMSDAKIDILNPLAGRLICFWPNPYANQQQKTALLEAMHAHPDYLKLKQENQKEAERLLYVGMTRARDYMIFATPHKKTTSWLNSLVFQDLDEEKTVALPPNVPTLIWPWKGEHIPVRYKSIVCADNTGDKTPPHLPVSYWPAYSGEKNHDVVQVENAADLLPLLNAHFGGQIQFAQPFALPQSEDYALDYAQTAQLFGRFICADRPNTAATLRLNAAENLLKQYEVDAQYISPQLLMQFSTAFHQQIDAQPAQYKQHRRTYRLAAEPQYYIDTIDLHIITAAGEHYFLLCPDMQTAQPQQLRHLVAEQAYRFFAAQQALAPQATQVSKFFALLPLEGQILQLIIQPQGQKAQNLSLF